MADPFEMASASLPVREIAAKGMRVLTGVAHSRAVGTSCRTLGLPGIVAGGLRLVGDGSNFGCAFFAGGREPPGDLACLQAQEAHTHWREHRDEASRGL